MCIMQQRMDDRGPAVVAWVGAAVVVAWLLIGGCVAHGAEVRVVWDQPGGLSGAPGWHVIVRTGGVEVARVPVAATAGPAATLSLTRSGYYSVTAQTVATNIPSVTSGTGTVVEASEESLPLTIELRRPNKPGRPQ